MAADELERPDASAAGQQHQRAGREQRERAPLGAQGGPEVAAGAAGREVAQRSCGRAAARVMRGDELLAHQCARGPATDLELGEAHTGAMDQRSHRRLGQPQLSRELRMANAVKLAPDERVALVLRQHREVAEQLAQARTALGGNRRLLMDGRRDALTGDRQVHRVGPHAAQLVQAAVADQAVEPRAQIDRAFVAKQRAVGAQQRLLDDVLSDAVLTAEYALGKAHQPRPVALADRVEGPSVAPAQRGDQALVAQRRAAGHSAFSEIQPTSPARDRTSAQRATPSCRTVTRWGRKR